MRYSLLYLLPVFTPLYFCWDAEFTVFRCVWRAQCYVQLYCIQCSVLCCYECVYMPVCFLVGEMTSSSWVVSLHVTMHPNSRMALPVT